MAGASVLRYKWYRFRKRFDELRLSPVLDYSSYWQQDQHTGTFRFTGDFESVTDGQTLWIRSEDLTIPVSLKKAETYLLPQQKGESHDIFNPAEEAPEKIRWKKISMLYEGARVFVGGSLVNRDDRRIFASTKENPLTIIFYSSSDDLLAARAIRSCRRRREYWNAITPYSLAIGALCLILMAYSFMNRPAYQLTVMVSIAALFVPLYPMIPPGLLFTVICQRLAWRSRRLRAFSDLARLPLRYLEGNKGHLKRDFILPGGERYGYVIRAELPQQAAEEKIPLLLPMPTKTKTGDAWHIFGIMRPDGELPSKPEDPLATYGILPGQPNILARRYAIRAYVLEFISWIIMLAGIGLNIFFIGIILDHL